MGKAEHPGWKSSKTFLIPLVELGEEKKEEEKKMTLTGVEVYSQVTLLADILISGIGGFFLFYLWE